MRFGDALSGSPLESYHRCMTDRGCGLVQHERLWIALESGGPDEQPPLPELDRLIRIIGPHELAHCLLNAPSPFQASQLNRYLAAQWPAHLKFIEQMIRAATLTPENEDLRRDFGEL